MVMITTDNEIRLGAFCILTGKMSVPKINMSISKNEIGYKGRYRLED